MIPRCLTFKRKTRPFDLETTKIVKEWRERLLLLCTQLSTLSDFIASFRTHSNGNSTSRGRWRRALLYGRSTRGAPPHLTTKNRWECAVSTTFYLATTIILISLCVCRDDVEFYLKSFAKINKFEYVVYLYRKKVNVIKCTEWKQISVIVY